MATGPKDNSTFRQKLMLRQAALRRVTDPVVLETHVGFGKLGAVAYADVRQGAALERDEKRAETIASARPTWAVYAGDSAKLLRAGAAGHLPVNFIDLDPWGDPWPVLQAFMESPRPRVETLMVVVNDGLRQKAQLGGAWSTETLAAAAERIGNAAVYARYLDVCRDLMREVAAKGAYRLAHFAGYYAGPRMTHYAATLERA